MFFRSPRYAQVVWLPSFARTVAGVLDEEEVRHLENHLVQYPRSGVLLSGTGGARKIRAAVRGRGKSGSVRVIYFFDEPCEQIYLLLAYPKTVQASLTPEQARRVRSLVEVLKAQDCYGNER
jgi:mRNA-degrading endonuclease RelE of RelBE toxin-antitoxin system